MGLPMLALALAIVAPSADASRGTLHPVAHETVEGRTVHVTAPKRRLHAVGGLPAPANCDLAVGPTSIVQVTNGRVAFFDKAGTQTFEQSAGDFFGGLAQTGSQDEPRAGFEEASGRFVIGFLEHDLAGEVCNLLLAVSDDSDPTGIWHQYSIDANRTLGKTKFWLARPSLGFNSEGLVVTGTYTEYTTAASGGSGFIVLPLAPLLSGDPAIVVKFVDVPVPYAYMAESPGPFVYGAAQTDPNEYRMYRAEDVGTANPLIRFRDVTGATSPLPPATVPSTGGASLETQTNRILDVAWRDDRLLIVNNSGSTVVGIRHHVYDTSTYLSGAMTILASKLVSSPSVHYFLPACALNKWLDVAEVFNGSSTSVTSDLLWSGRIATEHGGIMSTPIVLASGLGSPYLDTLWGQYAGLDVDPVDGETFWATAMTVAADGWWTTHLESFVVSKTSSAAPSSFSWFRGVWQSGDVASLAEDDGDYNVAKAGLVLFPSEPPAQVVVEGTAPAGEVLGLELSVVARVNTPGLAERIELWNWATGSYVVAGTFAATTADSAKTVAAPGAPADFVDPVSGAVRARVAFYRTGLTLVWPWTAMVDQVEWRVRVRP